MMSKLVFEKLEDVAVVKKRGGSIIYIFSPQRETVRLLRIGRMECLDIRPRGGCLSSVTIFME